MNILSLDCEFNQPSGNLIQIGACLFKVGPSVFELTDTFITYVELPKGETINPEITELTRITMSNLLFAPTAKEAYYKLKVFHKNNKCFMNPIVWGSGTRNDSDLIYRQADPSEPNFMGFRVIDAKTLYQSRQMTNNLKVKAGLKSALEELNIGWDSRFGEPHDALADAYNTGVIWNHLSKKLK